MSHPHKHPHAVNDPNAASVDPPTHMSSVVPETGAAKDLGVGSPSPVPTDPPVKLPAGAAATVTATQAAPATPEDDATPVAETVPAD